MAEPDIEMSLDIDYVSVLNDNVRKTKERIKKRLSRIRSLLDEKEETIIQFIDQTYKEKLEEIRNLEKIRSHSLAFKEIMEEIVDRENHPIQVGPNCSQLDESTAQIERQLSALSTVEDNWNLDKIEKALDTNEQEEVIPPNVAIDSVPQLQITSRIKKGKDAKTGQLSNQIGDVAVDQETGHVYIADRANNCVQMYKKSGEFLTSISHQLMESPNSICLSSTFLYSCNYKPANCGYSQPNTHSNPNHYPGQRQCTIFEQYLVKFSKTDFQVISFLPLGKNYTIISPYKEHLYLYRFGFENSKTTLSQSLVKYNEIFQNTQDITLTFQENQEIPNKCQKCDPSRIPVVKMKLFDDEIHFLMKDFMIRSFDLKGVKLREISVRYGTLSDMCWDGQINGRLILVDSSNKRVLIVSQLGKFDSEIAVKNSSNYSIHPVAIGSSNCLSYYSILCDNVDNWMLQELMLP